MRIPSLSLAPLSLVPLAFAASACDGRATPADCEAMLDRYVGMVAGGDPDVIAARKASPAYVRAETKCQAEVSRREVRCALKAPTPEAWEACID